MNKQVLFRKQYPKNLDKLSERIKRIMQDHVGHDNEITRLELFKKIFGDPKKFSEIQIWYLWDKVRKQLNWLRKTTNCFIGSRQVQEGVYSYFVLKDESDLKFYKDILKNNIKRMNYMMDRAEKLVRQEAYKKYLIEMEMIEKEKGE